MKDGGPGIYDPGRGFIVMENELTEREILACLTAVCGMPESDLKREVLRQMVPIMERLNHPMMSIEP